MRRPPTTPPNKPQRYAATPCWHVCLTLAVLIGLTATPAVGQSEPAQRLQRIERDLESGRATRTRLNQLSRALAGEIAKLRSRMAEAATRAQRTERTMAEVEARLDVLHESAGETQALLAGRRGELAQLLGALQRLARRPPETLLLTGRPPLETVHTGILLEAAIPGVNAAAIELRDDLARMARLEAEIREQRDRLTAAAVALDGERQRLAALAAEKAALLNSTERKVESTAQRVRQLADSARSLRELVQSLDAQAAQERAEQQRLAALVRPEPRPSDETTAPAVPAPRSSSLSLLPGAPAVSTAKGGLFPPAIGRVTRGFGQTDPEGLRDRGMVLRTRSGTAVVAPYDGTVLYAGTFEEFGLILIIEHGEGYHTLLAGLGRIDLGVGQRVLAGEPVGAMANSGGDGGVERGPELYVELRHNGDPIDPLPWFAGLTEKAKG